MNYIDRIAGEVARELGDEDASIVDQRLYRIYALLVILKGWSVTCEDIHDAWSVWMADIMPDHRSLIPFSQLTPDVQALDEPYRDALVRVAKRVVIGAS